MVMPLGNGFTMPRNVTKVKPLLFGGGVGTAPMLMLGAELVKMGCTPAFLLGARSSKDLFRWLLWLRLPDECWNAGESFHHLLSFVDVRPNTPIMLSTIAIKENNRI